MADDDKGFLDHVKDALGMNDDADDRADEAIDMERGAGGDVRMSEGDPIGGVDGATQASGRVGATGGLGASGAMGGAGAGGPIGDEPTTSYGRADGSVDEGAVRTEYEMGHEFDPEHERVAESGLFAERSGAAENDTWRDDADEWQGGVTRGERAAEPAVDENRSSDR